MPRVELKKKEYMVSDLPGWIIGRMHVLKLRQVDVARELGISQSALSHRLDPKKAKKGEKPEDPFKYGDLLTLFKVLEATDEEKVRLLSL